MKIFMVGEAANYKDRLAAELGTHGLAGTQIVALPREAASAADHDGEIGAEDVVISLRLKRGGAALPRCRLLHVPGAGLDGIDFDALADTTTVCNVFEHEGAIAEFVLASVLNWEIRLDELRASFVPERWAEIYRSRVPHGELSGKTVGLVGFGRIGRAIAVRAKAFGVRILAADPALSGPQGPVDEVVALGELLERADYVVIACPLMDATRGMVGAAELAGMQPGAVLINISRAEVVDEAALFAALQGGAIRGASLDVWYRYPSGAADSVPPSTYPFHDLPNVVCTPHSSAITREMWERRYAIVARNIAALVHGRPLDNVVRPGRA
ncbi:MAG: hypothetical protein KDA49_12490 [Rhodospirillaceae bacterium]|nr:hypothetical protein [Rhodospirillaceae bacterium]MCA8933284.1 hypothetical protein [Rhodospirillaceae bacterium]